MRATVRQRGFTLIEMVLVIVILGVIGATVSIFMKLPIDAYLASASRASLTDVADTVTRRMARDIKKALPNSLSTPTDQCIEFIPTKTGARYREQDINAGDNTSLNFSALDNQFNMLGSNNELPPDQRIAVGDAIVVYNLGIPGANAMRQDNTAWVTAVGAPTVTPSVETAITTTTARTTPFPLPSGNHRFQVIPAHEQIVSYVCSAGQLHRTVRALDALGSLSPASVCPDTGAILANNVSTCAFDYSATDLQRNALVHLLLRLSARGETVSLQQDVHMSNAP